MKNIVSCGNFIALLRVLLFFILMGCKSRPLGPYVSPKVVGQVLEADSKQALAGVLVSRGSSNERKSSPPRGAELLMIKAPVQTDENGHFALASERMLSVVRGADWDMVSLSFERAGYLAMRTNYFTGAMTNSPSGEPVLDLGPVFLQRAPRPPSTR